MAVEELSPGGQPRRQSLRTAELNLGRNERGELMHRLQAPGPAGQPRAASPCAPRASSPASLQPGAAASAVPRRQHSPGQRRQLLLSGAPDRLRRFLHTLRLSWL